MWLVVGFLVQAGVIYLASVFSGLEYADFWRSVTVAIVAWIVSILLLPLLLASLFAGGALGIIISTVVGALAVLVAVKVVMSTDWGMSAKIAVWYLVLIGIYRFAVDALVGTGA